MRMQMFTAERSLYRGSGYYAALSGAGAPDRVVAAQTLPKCNSGNFTNCFTVPPSVCDQSQCAQRCITPSGGVGQECCPPGQCGGNTGGCCKTVCCNITVS